MKLTLTDIPSHTVEVVRYARAVEPAMGFVYVERLQKASVSPEPSTINTPGLPLGPWNSYRDVSDV
jgi:hypothetical protein